jgi:hypothetical protein
MLTMKLSVFCTESAAKSDRLRTGAFVAEDLSETALEDCLDGFRGGPCTNFTWGPLMADEVVLCGLFGISMCAAIPGELNVAQV